MRRYLILTLVVILTGMILAGCETQCPCDQEVFYPYACTPREASITKFSSDFSSEPQVFPDGVDPLVAERIVFFPSDDYSSHCFQFPNDIKTSGSLPNNELYKPELGIGRIPIKKIKLSAYGINLPYSFAILSEMPNNADINGDILVKEVEIDKNDATLSFSQIMLSGYLHKINRQFSSESSKDFCSMITDEFFDNGKLDKEKISNYRNSAENSKYGINITDKATIMNYTNEPVYLINSLGQIVVDFTSGSPIINKYSFINNAKAYDELLVQLNLINNRLSDARRDLFFHIEKEKKDIYVTVKVAVGDVFFYRTKNGRDFIFAVINISERPEPLARTKKRISIIFNNI